MKCEKCGKAEATCHYSSNINGKITESHLCPECASQAEWGHGFFDETDRMFNDMFGGFDDFFGGMRRMMPSFGFDRFFGLPAPLPTRSALGLRERPAQTETQAAAPAAGAPQQTETAPAADPELSKRREINELREQMKAAAEAEEFEKAAEIRDKLRELEK
ncbi:MAG: UvrB/UvrC motif-containing protein [Oscillospiraceae bacterium]|nr:UvrB/UvrC motif-containing protein [Oscillospiraceae bacterium]